MRNKGVREKTLKAAVIVERYERDPREGFLQALSARTPDDQSKDHPERSVVCLSAKPNLGVGSHELTPTLTPENCAGYPQLREGHHARVTACMFDKIVDRGRHRQSIAYPLACVVR